MKRENGYGTVGWLLLGGVAGACAALLLAPASGKKTRERLTRRLRETKESVTDIADGSSTPAGTSRKKRGASGARPYG